MSKSDTWMPLYIGDYLADTMHLTGPAHGAYMLLLMHEWRTGPLPNDDAALAAIARTDASAWKRMASTIRAFFVETAAGLVQPRLERERQKADANSEKRRLAGLASAEAKRLQRDGQQEANTCSTHVGAPLEQTGRPLPLPTSSNEEVLPPNPRKRNGCGLLGFEEFWSAYPRRVGRGAAEKVWPRAVARAGDPEPIIAGLKAQLEARQFDLRDGMKFCPHAATWLNRDGWLDEIGKLAGNEFLL